MMWRVYAIQLLDSDSNVLMQFQLPESTFVDGKPKAAVVAMKVQPRARSRGPIPKDGKKRTARPSRSHTKKNGE